MAQVEYKQGMTLVWCDGEKIIITNPTGTRHLEDNVDRIFGVGEYKKIFHVKYSFEQEEIKTWHTARGIKLISGYIPQRAVEDLKLSECKEAKSTIPDISGKDLVDKYFGEQK